MQAVTHQNKPTENFCTFPQFKFNLRISQNVALHQPANALESNILRLLSLSKTSRNQPRKEMKTILIKATGAFLEARWKNKTTHWFKVSPPSAGGLLYQLIELVLCFEARWLAHGPNGFQLGLRVYIKSSSGKVAAKSNHLVRLSCQRGARW